MSEVVSVSEMFGKDVFNDAVMKDRLPKSVITKKLKKDHRRMALSWIQVLQTLWHMP